jgi:hypothetical protein
MSRIQVFLVLFAAVLLLPFTNAQGQQEFSGLVSTPPVKTFTVTPADRPAAILAPNAMVAGPPGPIAPSMMQDILAGIGGSEGGAHFVLTSRQPYIDGQGYLTLTLPQTVHPESAIVFDKDSANAAGVKLKVEKDGLYLVDFAVKAKGAGVYKVETESGGQEFEDSNGKLEHLLIALNAGASGWTTVRMNRTGAGHNLYSVEVTRAN